MIPFNPRPPVTAYWNPTTGAWMPTHRRVAPPKRWLRIPLIILLASAICFGASHLAPWGEATAPIGWLGPCHVRAAVVAMPLFADAGEGERDD